MNRKKKTEYKTTTRNPFTLRIKYIMWSSSIDVFI